jgi:drug/metabolite transporter (DMT)-like permease
LRTTIPFAEHAVEPTRDRATDLGLLALAAIWGVNFSVVKAVLGVLDPMALNALRFPMAAAVLAAVVSRIPGPALEAGDRVRLAGLGILGNVVYQMAFILGVDATLAGNASLLLATSPVWTVLLSAALGHEKPRGLVFLGSAVTFGGMALVILGGEHALGLGRQTLRGDALMIGAAVLWSIYTVSSGRYVRKYGAIRVTAWTLWTGTPVLVLIGIPALVSTPWRDVSVWVWAGVAYAGVLSVGVAYVFWYRGILRLGNSRTALYSNLVPVAALLTAWAWLGEVPSALQICGASVILGGISVARWGARRSYSPGPSALR